MKKHSLFEKSGRFCPTNLESGKLFKSNEVPFQVTDILSSGELTSYILYTPLSKSEEEAKIIEELPEIYIVFFF